MKSKMNNRGQTNGLVSGLVFGVVGFILAVIIGLIMASTLVNANLLTGSYQAAVNNLSSNLTSGVDQISPKIPTVFTVAAVVLILSVLLFLFAIYQRMRLGGGGTL